jgi:low temperature requirement protein LtrA
MRTSTLTRARRLALTVVGYFQGHMMMVCGLILIATSLKLIFLDLTRPAASGWMVPVPGGQLALLYAGVAVCLAGQFVFSFCTVWRLSEWPRLAGAAVLFAAIPVLSGEPVLLVLAVPAAVCGVLRRVDHVTKPSTVRHLFHGVSALPQTD